MERLLRLLLCLVAVAVGLPANAHQFQITDVRIELTRDARYRIDIRVDVDALALGVAPVTDSAEVAQRLRSMSEEQRAAAADRARATLLRRVRVRFDDVPVEPEIVFPGDDDPRVAGIPTVLGTIARLEGPIPETATELTFFASRAFGSVHVRIHEQATGSEANHVLVPGERTPPFALGQAQSSAGSSFVEFVRLGFAHILPRGLDHILFVLGLFLLSTRTRALLWQVTAFTVAHSITLGLSLYGVIELPPRPVETLIALSIAYVGIENLLTSELKPWRPALVFVFGLLHGLGFAGVLREIELPPDRFVTALAGFNIGVELGQLAVIGLAFACVGWCRRRQWYRARIVIPASAVIALTGLYWSVQRAFG